ncbi:MAG TPA: hypothetical protein VFC78_07040 [Tepidisphaeraceae bacterium]|nr:hypothetical protein [Tepidisphaeraceae bacterium]
MSTISKDEAILALCRLGEVARLAGANVELLLLGGGAMVLSFNARQSTKDLDVVILAPDDRARVYEWAKQIAFELSWPDDWLNDAVKGFVVSGSDCKEVLSSPGIRVWVPAVEQLLAMKLCAWRDDVDIGDARRLLRELTGSNEDIWRRVEPLLLPGRELKARYAFADLWESTHGDT